MDQKTMDVEQKPGQGQERADANQDLRRQNMAV